MKKKSGEKNLQVESESVRECTQTYTFRNKPAIMDRDKNVYRGMSVMEGRLERI